MLFSASHYRMEEQDTSKTCKRAFAAIFRIVFFLTASAILFFFCNRNDSHSIMANKIFSLTQLCPYPCVAIMLS